MEFKLFSGQICFLSVVWSVLLLTLIGSAEGNIKTADGKIIWNDLPPQPMLNTSIEDPQFKFKAVFHVASEFIHAITTDNIPWGVVRDIINGTINIEEQYTVFINYSIGFIICLVIGLLFVVVMPFTGLIFFCCRCSENCGGKMLQRDKYNSSFRRISFGLSLTLVTALIILGLVGAFIANAHMSSAVQNVDDSIKSNAADLNSYVKNTFEELHFLTFEQFGFLLALIVNDVNSLGDEVGLAVQDAFSAEIEPAMESLLMLAEESVDVKASLVAVNNSAKELTRRASILQTSLERIQSEINQTLNAITCTPDQPCPKDVIDLTRLTIGADFSIINIEPELAEVNNALQTNLTQLALQGQQEFANIPARVNNESLAAREMFISELNRLKSNLQNSTQELIDEIRPIFDKIVSKLTNSSDDETAEGINKTLTSVETYDQTRFYIGVSLCCIIIVIVLCNLLGVLFGECGRESRDRPTERGCLSNFGGTLLLTGVVCSFLFSAVIMVLTTMCFLLGGLSETIICEPLESKAMFREVIDYPYLMDPRYEYWISDPIYGPGSLPLTAEKLINSCESNAGIYPALKLENLFNISEALDYKKLYPDLTQQLFTIQVDLSNFEILDPAVVTALNGFAASGVAEINYTLYLNEIRKGISQVNLLQLAHELEILAENPANNPMRLAEHIFTLRATQTNQVVPMDDYVNTLEANLKALVNSTNELEPLVNETLENALKVQDEIRAEGSTVVDEELNNHIEMILGYVDQYVLFVLTNVNNNVGACKPVANLYNSMTVLLCRYAVDSFNGFWLSLGWCVILFIPSIIFAVKLSKFYRRMRFYEDYYNNHDMETIPMKNYGTGAS